MNTRPPQDGFDALGEAHRTDYRIAKDGDMWTQDNIPDLIVEMDAYRQARGREFTLKRLAEQIEVSYTALIELRKSGWYRGDVQKLCRRIDEFLADERRREGGYGLRSFTPIRLTSRIFGVIKSAIRHNSMAVIIGDSGDGKSQHAQAFAMQREGVLHIRIDEANGDQRGVTLLLYRAFKLTGARTHRERLAAVIAQARKRRNLVIVVDEAQKLTSDGLEILRDIHDGSDPNGSCNTPLILFGDPDFYRLILKARNGEPSPIKPQMTRRMYPILNLNADGAGGDGMKYTAADIVAILRNQRVRVVTDEGVSWLASLANVSGYGSLGFALAVARMALDIASKMPATVDDLQAALGMMLGPRAVGEIDHAAGGRLLTAKVG